MADFAKKSEVTIETMVSLHCASCQHKKGSLTNGHMFRRGGYKLLFAVCCLLFAPIYANSNPRTPLSLHHGFFHHLSQHRTAPTRLFNDRTHRARYTTRPAQGFEPFPRAYRVRLPPSLLLLVRTKMALMFRLMATRSPIMPSHIHMVLVPVLTATTITLQTTSWQPT